MPKITHVAKAQQRYQMVPLLDPVTGQPVVTVTHRARPTRRGKTEIEVHRTVPDKTQPLDPYDCGWCHKPIEIGTPYKHMSVKRTFGGITYRRHESCPDWKPYEYSTATWAMVARVQDIGVDSASWESVEDAEAARDELASEAGEVRDEKQGNLDNMPEGLADSSELYDMVSMLEDWVSEIEQVDFPDLPEEIEDGEDCLECEGTGTIGDGDNETDCPQCQDGKVELSDDDREAKLEEWREEAGQVLQDALDSYQG